MASDRSSFGALRKMKTQQIQYDRTTIQAMVRQEHRFNILILAMIVSIRLFICRLAYDKLQVTLK